MNTSNLTDSMQEAANQIDITAKDKKENILADLQVIIDIMNIIEVAQKKRQENKTSLYLKQTNFTIHCNSSNDSQLSFAKITKYNVRPYVRLQMGTQVFTNFKNIFCGN